MTPGARLQAAIELLAAIHDGTSPADRAAAAYFRERRYIGGGDRRDIIDRVYAVLRRRAPLDWWIDREAPLAGLVVSTGEGRERARIIAMLSLLEGWSADRIAGSFDGGKYRPPRLTDAELRLAKALAGQPLQAPGQPDWVRLEYPAWLEPELRARFAEHFEAEMAALIIEAPLDLRVNTLKATRGQATAALAEDGVKACPTPLSPVGLRVDGRPPLATMRSFKEGLVEVQDEGSQLVALLADARPGMRVVDFCAGAGGKTLALAAAMRNKGHLVATDVLPGRIERSAVRLRRAGVHNVERRPLSSERDPWVKRHAGSFDRVLIDAPCTGCGTWRRNPDAKWRLSPDDLAELLDLQQRILDSAARLVKPGGRLIYGTCSLLPAENDSQVNWFLAHQPAFALLPIPMVWKEALGTDSPVETPLLALSPAAFGTDGFFVAVMQRKVAAPTDEPTPA